MIACYLIAAICIAQVLIVLAFVLAAVRLSGLISATED